MTKESHMTQSKPTKCELPSYIEAQEFWEKGEVLPVVGTYLQRSLLIATPLYFLNRDLKVTAQNALLASLAVEVYVLYKTKQIIDTCG